MLFKDTLIEFFGFWKRDDSYKNAGGKGLMERFNEVVGEDLDDELSPLIDNLIPNSLIPDTCFSQLLTYLEQNVGSDLFLGSATSRRRQARRMIHRYYGIRGTITAYELMFDLMGYTIGITEDFTAYGFDRGIKFDHPVRRFDMGCPSCTSYRIDVVGDYWDAINGISTIPVEHLEAFKSIIIFNQPINATLLGVFINNGSDYQILSYNNSYS